MHPILLVRLCLLNRIQVCSLLGLNWNLLSNTVHFINVCIGREGRGDSGEKRREKEGNSKESRGGREREQ